MNDELGRGNSQAYCPQCLAKCDGFLGIGEGKGHRPKGGDVSMCLDCKTVLAFNDDLTLRLANQDEKATFNQAAMMRVPPKSVSAEQSKEGLGEEFMSMVYKQLVIYFIRQQGGEITLSVEELQREVGTGELRITAEGTPANQILKFKVRKVDGKDELQAN